MGRRASASEPRTPRARGPALASVTLVASTRQRSAARASSHWSCRTPAAPSIIGRDDSALCSPLRHLRTSGGVVPTSPPQRAVAKDDNRGWSLYGVQRPQPVATGSKSHGRANRGRKAKPLPSVATSCLSRSMVRRGSTVRVRQSAQKSRKSGDFCGAMFRAEPWGQVLGTGDQLHGTVPGSGDGWLRARDGPTNSSMRPGLGRSSSRPAAPACGGAHRRLPAADRSRSSGSLGHSATKNDGDTACERSVVCADSV
jgi:hypothetical protein